MGEAFALVGPFALLVTKVVDVFKQALDPGGTRIPKVIWNFVAMAAGVTVALVWNVNAVNSLGAATSLQGSMGEVMTGLLISGVAAGWHEVLDYLIARQDQANAATMVPKTRTK